MALAMIMIGLMATGLDLAAQQVDKSKAPVSEKPLRCDFYGDPLPAGALVRMGSVQLRHPQATVAFGANSKTLISAGPDRTIRFWDRSTGKETRRGRLPEQKSSDTRFDSLNLSSDGKVLAAWLGETACLYDSNTGKEIHRMPVPAAEGVWFFFSPDNTVLGIRQRMANGTSLFQVWGLSPLAKRWSLESKDSIGAIAFSPNGKLIALSTGDGFIEVRDTTTGQHSVARRAGDTWQLRFSANSKILAFGSLHEGCVHLWDANDLTERDILRLKGIDQVLRLVHSPDGKILAIGGDKELILWDLGLGKEAGRIHHREGSGVIRDFIFSPDGKVIASAGDVAIRVWNVDTGQELHVRPGHLGEVWSLAVSADGNLIASGCLHDPKLGLWELALENLFVFSKVTTLG
jgi:WD40 repeat protein